MRLDVCRSDIAFTFWSGSGNRAVKLRREALDAGSHWLPLQHRNEDKMKQIGTVLVVLATALTFTLASAASAHNRAHVILPSGECMIVGSEKSVTLPDGSLLDLRPETTPADEIGTAFAAEEGNSALEKGACS